MEEDSKASLSKNSVDGEGDEWQSLTVDDFRRHVAALEKEKAQWRALVAEKEEALDRLIAAAATVAAADGDRDGSRGASDAAAARVADDDLRFVADAPDYEAVVRDCAELQRRMTLAAQHHRDFVEGLSTVAPLAKARSLSIIYGLMHDEDDDAATGTSSAPPP